MTKKLNQVLAIEKSLKGRVETVFSLNQAASQKAELLNGFHKTFQPLKENDVTAPPQSKRVQHSSKEIFGAVTKVLGELFTTTASKDIANCTARADVVVGGQTLLKGVPSTNLLFLDKQLSALHAFVSKFSELESDTNWTSDPATGLFRSEELKTTVTQKVQEPLILAPATPQHPAQTTLITRDVIVGHWNTTKLSGAIPRPQKLALLDKIQELQNSVKEALEEANSVAAGDNDYGTRVMNYLFSSVI